MHRRNWLKWVAAAAVLLCAVLISIGVGRYPLTPVEIVLSIVQRLTGRSLGMSTAAVSIVMDNRLPRTLAGILVGASLAASGCAFQGLFRNPLVSQGILGVSSGAGFGAALSILLFSGVVMAPPFAFFFGLCAVWLSFCVAKLCGKVSVLMLVLGGTIVSSIFSALLSLLKYVADPYNELAAIVFWNMGSLASIESDVLPVAVAAMAIGLALLLLSASWINVLSMGEDEAASLGVPVQRARILVVAGATLATAGAVSIAGTIGWIGLIIPHMARFLIKSDNRQLIPYSMLLGASFLVLVDTLCRTLSGAEIPLGIMTSLIGGPFFIYLLRRYKGGGWQ